MNNPPTSMESIASLVNTLYSAQKGQASLNILAPGMNVHVHMPAGADQN